MYWLLHPWRHAFDFSGRAPRREYWLFVLQAYAMVLLPFCVAMAVGERTDDLRNVVGGGFLLLAALGFLAIVIPGLAVAVRRLHDQNRSGVLLLLGLVPGLGALILLFFMLMEGDEHENDHGPNPRDPRAREIVSRVFD